MPAKLDSLARLYQLISPQAGFGERQSGLEKGDKLVEQAIAAAGAALRRARLHGDLPARRTTVCSEHSLVTCSTDHHPRSPDGHSVALVSSPSSRNVASSQHWQLAEPQMEEGGRNRQGRISFFLMLVLSTGRRHSPRLAATTSGPQ